MFFKLVLAHIFELQVEAVADLLTHGGRPRRRPAWPSPQVALHIHSVAEDVLFINDDVAEVNSNPECDYLVRRQIRVARLQATLDIGRTSNRVHYAWKLSQYSVAGRLKDTTLVLIDLGIDDLCP